MHSNHRHLQNNENSARLKRALPPTYHPVEASLIHHGQHTQQDNPANLHWFPGGIAIDGAGNIYLADSNNNQIHGNAQPTVSPFESQGSPPPQVS